MWLLSPLGLLLLFLLLLVGLLLLTVRLLCVLTMGECRSDVSMAGKTVIVTGANSGIGKETALELAKRGARVIMACRNMETGAKARDELAAAVREWESEDKGNGSGSAKGGELVLMRLDLGSLRSVRDFADEFTRSERRLHVLVHNAGMANTFGRRSTDDGLEVTLQTNHLGPFLLTHLLVDLLKSSAPSRVVVVASSLYRLGRLSPDGLNQPRALPAYLYYVSKLANIHFTTELARRLQGTGVTANCLHPGMIDSGIWRNVPFPLNLPLKLIVKGFFKNPKQGAQTSIYLAVSEEVQGVTGKYFSDCREAALNAAASDAAVAKKIWEKSEELVKLQPSDPRI